MNASDAYRFHSENAANLNRQQLRRFAHRKGPRRDDIVARIEAGLERLWQGAYARFKGGKS